jgi:hypothetical protein
MSEVDLIVFTSLPISNIFGSKLGLDYFKEAGFNVELWDTSPVYFSKEKLGQYFGGNQLYKFSTSTTRYFISQEEVFHALDNTKPNALIWHISRFHKNVEDDWLFSYLNKRQRDYFLQHFDTNIAPTTFKASLRPLLRGLKQQYVNRIVKPKAVIGSGSLGRAQVKDLYPQAKFISIPSVKTIWDVKERPILNSYIVFVDENIEYAPDAQLLGYQVCTNPDAYYARLNTLFEQIEVWTGFPVIIAASGKYIYPKNRYNDRKLIYGKTLELIQHAELVIGHMSLALDQTVVSERPALILDDPDFTTFKRRDYDASLMHLLYTMQCVTHVNKEILMSAMAPDIPKMKEIVGMYLKEPTRSVNYYQSVAQLISELKI